jgi:hypothetical protein
MTAALHVVPKMCPKSNQQVFSLVTGLESDVVVHLEPIMGKRLLAMMPPSGALSCGFLPTEPMSGVGRFPA